MSLSSGSPAVSVITPAYQSGRFLGATIGSVIAQTFRDWEMVIVDDCSRDDTGAIAEEYARRDARVRYVRNEANRGPGPTRTEALRRARGRYVAFLDSDDLWDPEKLERQVAFMQRGGHAFSYTAYRVISEDGRLVGAVRHLPPQQGYRDMLKDTSVGCLTVMLDRERVGAVEFPPYQRNQDNALWLQILRGGIVAHGIPDELASYRLVGSSNTSNKLRAARAVWDVYRGQERLPLVPAVWYFAHYAWRGVWKHARWRREQRRAQREGPALEGSCLRCS